MFDFYCKNVIKNKNKYSFDIYQWKWQNFEDHKIGRFTVIAKNLREVKDIIYIHLTNNPNYNIRDKERVKKYIIKEK